MSPGASWVPLSWAKETVVLFYNSVAAALAEGWKELVKLGALRPIECIDSMCYKYSKPPKDSQNWVINTLLKNRRQYQFLEGIPYPFLRVQKKKRRGGEELPRNDMAFMSAAFFGDVHVFLPHIPREERLLVSFFLGRVCFFLEVFGQI